MAILTRYLIRIHLGPFLFSFVLITGLLFLNTIAQRLDQLMGKGLPVSILVEFAVLALPHTVALTLPMSVLVAVLYAFSDLTAENEFTAMTGGGVNPIRILMPLVGIGVILAGLMFLFNDRVMPEANHQLKNLLVDINRKSPTFQLREQVINEVVASTENGRRTYYLQASRIDPVTSEMRDIVIYDVGDPRARRTTYAEQGRMAFSPNQTDLFLTLYNGALYEVPKNEEGGFRRAEFQEQFLPIRGVANMLERNAQQNYRSDREMSTEQLAAEAEQFERERLQLMEQSRLKSRYAVRQALGWVARGDSLVPPPEPEGAEARGDGPLRPQPASLTRSSPDVQASRDLPPDQVTQGVVRALQTQANTEESLRLSAIKYRVEIHKKYAIAFACIVFVFIGAPLAIRFPRGGVGMVITVSVVVFALFWVFLIGGETLADRGYLGPALSMWLPNLVLLPPGLFLTSRIPRQVATARGGGWADLWSSLRSLVVKPVKTLAPGGRA